MKATRRYVGLRYVSVHSSTSSAYRGRVGIYSNNLQTGWLIPVSDSFGLRYAKDIKNLEWGDVVSGPVQEWTQSDWEAGGAGAYVTALSLLADVVPLSVAWSKVWSFTQEVVLELPRTEAQVQRREVERGFDLRNLTSGSRRASLESEGQNDASATVSGGHEAQWEITRDEIAQWVYPGLNGDWEDYY